MFFKKEHGVLCVLSCSLQKNAKECCALFGFVSHTKMIKSRKKKNGAFFFKVKTELNVLFCNIFTYIYIFIYLYISIYLYKSIYIYLYILKKRTQRSAFFCKRTKRSLCSFTFFAKECCILCVLLLS